MCRISAGPWSTKAVFDVGVKPFISAGLERGLSLQHDQYILQWVRAAPGTIGHGAYPQEACTVQSLAWQADEGALEVTEDCSRGEAV